MKNIIAVIVLTSLSITALAAPQFYKDKDSMTDEITHGFSIKSKERGFLNKHAYFYFRCTQTTKDFIISLPELFGADQHMKIRFDNAPMQVLSTSRSGEFKLVKGTDNHSYFIPEIRYQYTREDGVKRFRWAAPFEDDVKGSNQLVVRGYNYNGHSPRSYTFNLSGSTPAMNKVLGLCNFTNKP